MGMGMTSRGASGRECDAWGCKAGTRSETHPESPCISGSSSRVTCRARLRLVVAHPRHPASQKRSATARRCSAPARLPGRHPLSRQHRCASDYAARNGSREHARARGSQQIAGQRAGLPRQGQFLVQAVVQALAAVLDGHHHARDCVFQLLQHVSGVLVGSAAQVAALLVGAL